MKRLILAGVAVPALLTASVGFAADLPRRVAPAYMPPIAPIFTWTGFYAGLNGGGLFGDFNSHGRVRAGSPSGGTIGGTAGYNYQIGNLVLGLEADVAYAAVNNTKTGPGPITSKGTLNFQDTIRGRVGYAYNRLLFFATGGYAGGTVNSTVYDTPNNFYSAQSNYLNGYAVGAGVEYAVMPNLSAKLEYLYTDLGSAYNFAHTVDATRVGLSSSNIRAGINYHF